MKNRQGLLAVLLLGSVACLINGPAASAQNVDCADNYPCHVVVEAAQDLPDNRKIDKRSVIERVIPGERDPSSNLITCQQYAIGRIAQRPISRGDAITMQSIDITHDDMQNTVVPMHEDCVQWTFLRALRPIRAKATLSVGDFERVKVPMDYVHANWKTSDTVSLMNSKARQDIQQGQMLTTQNYQPY